MELVASDAPATLRHWETGPIPARHTLRGFHNVTLWLDEVEATAELLTELMGYQFVGQQGTQLRLPRWLEDNRAVIEQSLPDFELKPVLKDALERVNA